MFYVYIHTYKSGEKVGKPFYVGKGKSKRAWKKSARNPHWNNIVDKYGYDVKVVKRFNSEDCAFAYEMILINTIGRENLCNMTDGGDGPSGVVRTDNQRQSISQALRGKKSPRYDYNNYHFVNFDGREYIGERYEFCSIYNVNENLITNLVAGRLKTIHGWSIYGRDTDKNYMKGDVHYAYDHTIRTFHHNRDGIFTGTSFAFRTMFDLPQSGVSAIVTRKRKSVKGWRLID